MAARSHIPGLSQDKAQKIRYSPNHDSDKSETIDIKFAPSAAGTRTASLQINSSDTAGIR